MTKRFLSMLNPFSAAQASEPAPSQPPEPRFYFVPENDPAVVYLPEEDTPERRLKAVVRDSDVRVIGAVGTGGSGKTTLARSFGLDDDTKRMFKDGVWYVPLGEDATIDDLADKLNVLLTKSCGGEFSEEFSKMLRNPATRLNAVVDMVGELSKLQFFLIFDDVWKERTAVYEIVKMILAQAFRSHGGERRFRILITTRERELATPPLVPEIIDVDRRDPNGLVSKRIICNYALVDVESLEDLTVENKMALEEILECCGGLPLALCVAGRAVYRAMKGVNVEGEKQNKWAEFRDILREDVGTLGRTGSELHADGLFKCISASLGVLSSNWPSHLNISASDVSESLSTLQKQVLVSLEVLIRMWNMRQPQAKEVLTLLSDYSLVSCVEDDMGLGLTVHDLVLDFFRQQCGTRRIAFWHERLVAGYAREANGAEIVDDTTLVSVSPSWIYLFSRHSYFRDNVTRHLLGCGRVNEVLALLVDYRWMQLVNGADNSRLPFQKIASDLEDLADYLSSEGSDSIANFEEIGKGVLREVLLLIHTLEFCIPMCSSNRSECAFQLYGRLLGVQQRLETPVGVITFCLWSVERFSSCPWAKPAAGLLTAAGGALRRRIRLRYRAARLDFGIGEELVVRAYTGEVQVLDCYTGSVKQDLGGQENNLQLLAVDPLSGSLYTGASDGVVRVWRDGIQVRSFEPFRQEGDSLRSMSFHGTANVVLYVSDNGKSRTINDVTGEEQDFDGPVCHPSPVRKSNMDGTILVHTVENGKSLRIWDVQRDEEIGEPLRGHEDRIREVAFHPDGRHLASVSHDKTVRVWDVIDGREIRRCGPNGHNKKVRSVIFSSDGRFLWSEGHDGVVGWELQSAQNEVVLKFLWKHPLVVCDALLRGLNGNELFAAPCNREEILVFGTAAGENFDDLVEAQRFAQGVKFFALSADGQRMATLSNRCTEIEFRNTCDVAAGIDNVLALHNVGDRFKGRREVTGIAVTNNLKFVAYSYGLPGMRNAICVAKIDCGSVPHTFTYLERWAEEHQGMNVGISQIRFDPDATNVAAEARVRDMSFSILDECKWITRIASWSMTTGALHDRCSVLSRSLCTPVLGTTPDCQGSGPYLFVPRRDRGCDWYDRAIHLCKDSKSWVAGRLDTEPTMVAFDGERKRLWLVGRGCGLKYVDLVWSNQDVRGSALPQLPVLQARRESMQRSLALPEGEIYTVFISHAGPDKHTIAMRVYEALVEAGVRVFLDIRELLPGEDAPKEMIDAMEWADIMIIVASPEFPARKWTMIELRCILRRIQEATERGKTPPVVIPVFYRLGHSMCSSEELFEIKDEKGHHVFAKEGFYRRMRTGGYSEKDVMDAMRQLSTYKGILNEELARNGSSPDDVQKQTLLAGRICQETLRARQRLEEARARSTQGT